MTAAYAPRSVFQHGSILPIPTSCSRCKNYAGSDATDAHRGDNLPRTAHRDGQRLPRLGSRGQALEYVADVHSEELECVPALLDEHRRHGERADAPTQAHVVLAVQRQHAVGRRRVDPERGDQHVGPVLLDAMQRPDQYRSISATELSADEARSVPRIVKIDWELEHASGATFEQRLRALLTPASA